MPANAFRARYLELNRNAGVCPILFLEKGRGTGSGVTEKRLPQAPEQPFGPG